MERSCIWNFNPVKTGKILPKSWDEFCDMFQGIDVYLLPDRATAEAVQALWKLIWLRECYNGDWVPIWIGTLQECNKYTIEFNGGEIEANTSWTLSSSPFYFKSAELRDEFLRNFRPLIEKLKPLYGIKEGGE